MTSITSVAETFFEAREPGNGWAVWSAYCTPDASFFAQAEPLLDVTTPRRYHQLDGVPARTTFTSCSSRRTKSCI
jgi:hypothetical protein